MFTKLFNRYHKSVLEHFHYLIGSSYVHLLLDPVLSLLPDPRGHPRHVPYSFLSLVLPFMGISCRWDDLVCVLVSGFFQGSIKFPTVIHVAYIHSLLLCIAEW